MMSLESEIKECPKCGGDHVYLTVDEGYYKCQDCRHVWAVTKVTSSRAYLQRLEKALGYSQRHLRRFFPHLGYYDALEITSDLIRIVIYPGGGIHPVPVARDADSVNGDNFVEVNISKRICQVFIESMQSGQQQVLTFNLKRS